MSPMNILLLEDNASLNKAVKEILELKEHHVVSFTDGLDVLGHINKEIDLYLLDITVPNINGVDVLKSILQTNPQAKAILMSADIALDTIHQSFPKTSVEIVKKPFMINTLLSQIAVFEKEIND
ncbi:MAG: hypothetical protein RL113_562 [Pseudomonadota bacterium]